MRRILIADDDRSIVQLLTTVLENAGFEVKRAYDGATALKLIKEYTPDLIIVDIMMPLIDGYKICKIISEEAHYAPPPKIVVLTVRKGELDRKISEFAGVDAFITKPFDTQQLLKTVNELLQL